MTAEVPDGRSLRADFFARPSPAVAADLVGKILWRHGVGGGRLVEVEAYLPTDDPASHAYRGATARNRSMFASAGHVYVFLSYGVHVLLNLVCDREGVGAAVLIRGLEPLGDVSRLRRNRGDVDGSLPLDRLCSGPGRVGRALGLSLDWDGKVVGPSSGLLVIDDGCRPPVTQTPRIGISAGRDLPLRYILSGSRYVSGRRGP